MDPLTGKAAVTAALIAVAGAARAEPGVLGSRTVPWHVDSGPVGLAGGEPGPRVVYATSVMVGRAAWLRLRFGAVELSGRVEEGTGSYLRITSLADGAVQYLDGVSARQWALTSAYFNGDAVLVELAAFPGVGTSRVEIESVTAGVEAADPTDTICGLTDDRALSSDPRCARHLPDLCTSFLIDDTNRMFLSAGHCNPVEGDVEQFNVPLSTENGIPVAPPPEDQYAVDPLSVLAFYDDHGPVGNDYSYFACYPNSNTGLTAYQRQGQRYALAAAAPPGMGQTIRLTGYGTVSVPLTPTWKYVQKTMDGPYVGLFGTIVKYQVDTTGGNSGSAVEEVGSGLVIGIHTNSGCTVSGGANQGTAMQDPPLAAALAGPRGLCTSGRGPVRPPLYAIGDGANNFGTVDVQTGVFGKVAEAPPRMEGLAYDWNLGVFWAVNNDLYGPDAGRKLYTISPATGAAALVATIRGAEGVINGLGYDPWARVLYGVVQATGQLVSIDPATGVATALGVPAGGRIGGLEYDPRSRKLFGIDDGGAESVLVVLSVAGGPATAIGPLGRGITDCNGLGVTDDGWLYTINAATRELLRIDPATGAATTVGPTGGVFGAGYGLAAVLTPPPPPACYANCDGSTFRPVLNINDFVCFLGRYAAGESYANCDGSTETPVLNVNDFLCYLNAYALGCP